MQILRIINFLYTNESRKIYPYIYIYTQFPFTIDYNILYTLKPIFFSHIHKIYDL